MSENDNKSKPDSKPDNPHQPKIVRAMYEELNRKISLSSYVSKSYRVAHRLVITSRPEFNIGDTEFEEVKVPSARRVNTDLIRIRTEIIGSRFANRVVKKNESENKILIKYQNAHGIKVTAKSIEKHTFNGHKNLISVYLDGVESIGDNAFGNCCHLKYLCISDSLKKIDAKVFEGCNSIIIFYSGTKEQWDKILKNNDWALGCKSIEINCKDKKITINNN